MHPPIQGPELPPSVGDKCQVPSAGLGFTDAAFKDLFNSVLDESLNWWRMRGLDHMTFGEFVEFLAHSPAKEAGVHQVVADEALASRSLRRRRNRKKASSGPQGYPSARCWPGGHPRAAKLLALLAPLKLLALPAKPKLLAWMPAPPKLLALPAPPKFLAMMPAPLKLLVLPAPHRFPALMLAPPLRNALLAPPLRNALSVPSKSTLPHRLGP